jgi:hypothetical protein
MNTAVITDSEADVLLASFTDWSTLTEAQKLSFIRRASIFAQVAWTCSSVVWEGDDEDIPDEVKEAVAYYAYADFKSNLFGDITSTGSSHGNLQMSRDKLGDLETERTYFKGGQDLASGFKSILGYPDSLMKIYCTRYTSSLLTRV